MKLSILSLMLAFTPGYGSGSSSGSSAPAPEWHPARPGDFRGPCPMMNTLANHGFLPRDGKNLTQEVVVSGLKRGINLHEALGTQMFKQSIIANPEPNATFFTLDQLNRHNVLEHDSSLSRLDAYFGNNHAFNQKVFDTTKAYWTAETVDTKMLANGKLFRQIQSRSTNPNYTFTSRTDTFSMGELAAPVLVFGDKATATVPRNLMEYFFENERLPTELGWQKKKNPVMVEDVMQMLGVVHNATNILTGGGTVEIIGRRDLHGVQF
ncbi:heme-thiolate peroxidase [Fusarium decemcellulare]|uniref:Heme-thiolate peroxidase n=1 Tax=Fusarium decemcellulare TaxID=57161 RepID=A0ACC1SN17_9HYPO|nr:heme-thiolate peroxidase [Fusarium decemcellulare]